MNMQFIPKIRPVRALLFLYYGFKLAILTNVYPGSGMILCTRQATLNIKGK